MSELEDRLPSDSSTDENSTAVGPTDNPRVDNDDSPVTNEHLMPSSSNGCKEVEEEASQTQPNVFAEFRQLLGKFRRQPPLSKTGNGESIAAKRKVEYDKIQPHMLEKDYVDGLPRLAALQDSNPSFCIFRRFGAVAVRIILGKQIELEQLVARLNKLDKEDNENPENSYRLKSIDFYDGCDPEQRELMEEIEAKFKDYYDFLLKYVDVRGLSPVDARHHRSVHTWVIDNRPLLEGEDAFIFAVDDFITARRASGHGAPQRSKIAARLESWISMQPRSGFKSWIHGFINGKTERSRTSNQYVHHYSDSRLEVLANIAASVVAIGILLMPAFILFLTDLSRGKMAAIVGFFVLVFIVIMSYLKGITPHSLIGVAIYSVFLVALSNPTQGTGPRGPTSLLQVAKRA